MLENLGRALHLIMSYRGVSQASLAAAAKIGKSQLSNYLNGRELPKLDSLRRVAQALDVGFVEIFTLMEELDRIREGLSSHDLSLLGRSSSTLMPEDLQEAIKRLALDVLHVQRTYLAAILRRFPEETRDARDKEGLNNLPPSSSGA